MKEEMQGFHMTRNYKIFISEITWLNHLYTFNWIYPRTAMLYLEKGCLSGPPCLASRPQLRMAAFGVYL